MELSIIDVIIVLSLSAMFGGIILFELRHSFRKKENAAETLNLSKIMSYNTVQGDLIELALKGEFDFIGHGANCQNVMGAGIALAVKEAFPRAYEADRDYPISTGIRRLGNYSCWLSMMVERQTKLVDLCGVINFYTQTTPGATFDVDACRLSFRKFATEWGGNDFRLGIPLIGCGIGGATWEEVEPLVIEELVPYFRVTVVEFIPPRQLEKRIREHQSDQITDA